MTIKEQYDYLDQKRLARLNRSRENAKLTIPSILPDDGFSETERLHVPWQGVGADACINLASRMLTSLYPPGQSNFELAPDPMQYSEEDVLSEDIKQQLIPIEGMIQSAINASGARQSFNSVLLDEIILSSSLFQVTATFRIRKYNYDQHVVQRAPNGQILKTIVKEMIDASMLPIELVEQAGLQKEANGKTAKEREVELYTMSIRESLWNHMTGETVSNDDIDGWVIVQEIKGKRLDTLERTKINRFVAPRWHAQDGENYGRSHVDLHRGSLQRLEHTSRNLAENLALGTRAIVVVDENGGIKTEDVAEAENGDIIHGRVSQGQAQGVGVVNIPVQNNAAIAQSYVAMLTQQVREAFLRSPDFGSRERVTAEEVRLNRNELEASLGGVYTAQAEELLQPYIEAVMDILSENGAIPEEVVGRVKPRVLVGFDALDRETNRQNIMNYFQVVRETPPLAERIKWEQANQTLQNLFSIKAENWVYSEEEFQQIKQQQLDAQQAAQAGGQIAQQAIQQQLEGGQQ